jgi:crossover junction endodeoxyribonuclease RuvC
LIIIGIDPSSTSTGYGLLEFSRRKCRYIDCGCIRPKRGAAFEDRLVFIYDRLQEILKECAADEAAIESTFFGKDADAAAKLGQARGVLLLGLRQAGLPIGHYSPASVKKAVAGNGRASKEQVQFMVARTLGLRELPKPLDASDALAIALCHVRRPGQSLTGKERQRRPEVEALLKRVVRR